MPEIRTAYLFTAKIATVFETTKFVGHNFLFNVSAILPKKIRDFKDFKDFKDFGVEGEMNCDAADYTHYIIGLDIIIL